MSKVNDLLHKLYTKDYQNEFVIIDGLNQHPDGLTFKEWMKTTHDLDVHD